LKQGTLFGESEGFVTVIKDSHKYQQLKKTSLLTDADSAKQQMKP
jgi:hypothetical protein